MNQARCTSSHQREKLHAGFRDNAFVPESIDDKRPDIDLCILWKEYRLWLSKRGRGGGECLMHLCYVWKHHKWHHLLACVNTSVYLITEQPTYRHLCSSATDADCHSFLFLLITLLHELEATLQLSIILLIIIIRLFSLLTGWIACFGFFFFKLMPKRYSVHSDVTGRN